MILLETERLFLRQWQLSDFPAFAIHFADTIQTRHIGGTKTPEKAWRLLASYIGHYQLLGYSYLAVAEKSCGNWIGSVGLWNSPPWPELELGYWFLKKGQGKGYATEAALALKKFAFETLNAPTLVSYIAHDNKPSIKLAEKLGAVYEKDIELLEFGVHGVWRYF